MLDLLFLRQPAHVEQNRIVRIALGHLRAHGVRPETGVKGGRIHTAPPQADLADAQPAHLLLHQLGRRQAVIGPVERRSW